MNNLINTPLFGIMVSLITFEIGCFLYKKTKLAILNPILISITLVIFILKIFNIDINAYNKGGDILSFSSYYCFSCSFI